MWNLLYFSWNFQTNFYFGCRKSSYYFLKYLISKKKKSCFIIQFLTSNHEWNHNKIENHSISQHKNLFFFEKTFLLEISRSLFSQRKIKVREIDFYLFIYWDGFYAVYDSSNSQKLLPRISYLVGFDWIIPT